MDQMNGPEDVSLHYLAMVADWYAAECVNEGLLSGGTPDRDTLPPLLLLFCFSLLLCNTMGF